VFSVNTDIFQVAAQVVSLLVTNQIDAIPAAPKWVLRAIRSFGLRQGFLSKARQDSVNVSSTGQGVSAVRVEMPLEVGRGASCIPGLH